MLDRIFAMLAGLSIEILLKGILLGLQEKFPYNHKLFDLCTCAGIEVCNDDKIILQSLTEHVEWASKYPAPQDESKWLFASSVFDSQRRQSGNLAQYYIQEREISLDNYLRLWELLAGYFWRVRNTISESAEDGAV